MIEEKDLSQPFYTPEEVAKMLRCGYFSIYNKIRYGDLEAHQIGRKWLITPEAILKYLNARSNRKHTVEK